MGELRSFIVLDRLQPQTMCQLGTWIRGRLPRTGSSAIIVEVAPGLDIEVLTDVATKTAEVDVGILVVERQFGYLEMHSPSADLVRSAGTAVLEYMGATVADASPPNVLGSRIVTRLDPQHAFLINRNRNGSLALPESSLFLMEVTPASYAILAANEAEKAAQITVVDCRMMGAAGRVYLTGDEANVREAAAAAEDALRGLSR